ncbi:MAG: hypothetical protein JWN31_92 [Frankiales bacterium]|nr:hypothetical protein [Frankiales bacterium]
MSGLPFTYAEVGATTGSLPAGYDHVRETQVLGTGSELFRTAVQQLMTWDLHRRSGLRILAAEERAVPGAVLVTSFGLGPLRLRIPCRVVYVVDEPRRVGFAYGTLPGHPEVGEELFVIELRDDTVVLTVTAFSRPGTWWSRLGRPVGRRVQRLVTRRYLAALIPPG